ncbi:MSHA biogenesis protein, MshG [Teredinibacter turnerae T7901]|uniref:MSHA biogenesis protein, MshG n=1 Tax=Teredinibacter turnerae (strain ATCC 39867 / T7901) TaxID=377629 RepID=C5BR27_TERTT|nr:type II secretion system F family protein [Teredinibacter turnerae]ACR11341.1 MSHA biogenesis protein, MshG [Teredinibacter turnerae T7901]
MAQFSFEGRSAQGQSVKGEIAGASVDAVAAVLVGRGITPVRINEVSLGASLVKRINVVLGSEQVPVVDLVMFCRQMYTVTKAGIPLTRGIRGLAASVRHEHFREVLNDVAEKLETGMSLSRAMRQHPKVFDSLFVSMINVGESSGKLDEIFRQIGFYLERDEETRKRVKSAMRYPSFVVVALVIAFVVINIYVIPPFAKMFSKFGAELPIVTRGLIATSNAFTTYWPAMLIVLVMLVGGATYYLRTEQGAYLWGGKKLRLPIIGSLIERASMARYARSFSLMLSAGVPITQSLSLCAAAIDNPFLSAKIQQIRQGVERGETLLRTHLQAELFTPLVLQMISVGEESGQVDNLLRDVAEFYEREVDYDLKTLTDRIEPLLIIVLAVFVTLLALGIFLPLWSLYDVQTGGM